MVDGSIRECQCAVIIEEGRVERIEKAVSSIIEITGTEMATQTNKQTFRAGCRSEEQTFNLPRDSGTLRMALEKTCAANPIVPPISADANVIIVDVVVVVVR